MRIKTFFSIIATPPPTSPYSSQLSSRAFTSLSPETLRRLHPQVAQHLTTFPPIPTALLKRMRSVHKFCPIAHHLGSDRSQVRKHCFQAQAGLIANDAPHVQRLPLSYSLYLPNQHSQIQSSEAPVNVANTSPIPGSAPTSTATGTSSAQASRALHQSAANARHVPSRPLSFLTHLPTPPATLNHTRKSPTPPRRQRSHPKLPQITTLKSSPPPGRGSLLVTLRKLERSVAGLTLDDGDARAALVLTLCRRYRSQLARGFSPSSSSVFSANTWPLEQPPRRRSLSSSTPTDRKSVV